MVTLDSGTENIDLRVLDLVVFWLKMPVLVATNTAGNVLTSYQKHLGFCHHKCSWKLSPGLLDCKKFLGYCWCNH